MLSRALGALRAVELSRMTTRQNQLTAVAEIKQRADMEQRLHDATATQTQKYCEEQDIKDAEQEPGWHRTPRTRVPLACLTQTLDRHHSRSHVKVDL